MDFCLRTFATLFLFFTATECAPAYMQDAWEGVRNRSQDLHQFAKNISLEVRNGSKDIDNFDIKLGWIESKDKCDPESLKREPRPCLDKILSVSASYSSVLENLRTCKSCAQHAETMLKALREFQKALRECNLKIPQVVSIGTITSEWEQKPLCRYTLDRLFSFSVITARVFAVGNPANHMAGLSQTCKATRDAAE